MKARNFFAFLLIPVSTLGFVVGFIAEMFMVGVRAGREVVERIADDSMRHRKGDPDV